MGKFCFPTNERARDQLMSNSQLFQRRGFLNSWDSIRFNVWFGVILGIIYLIFVQLCPQIMNWIGVVGGGIASIVLGATILAYRSVYFEGMRVGRGILGIILVIVGLYLLASSFLKQRQLRLNGVFLDHASRMVTISWSVLLWILFFMFLTFAKVVLNVFELFAFWSLKAPTFDPSNLFWQAQGGLLSVFLSLALLFQFYWALSFSKEACNLVTTQSISLCQAALSITTLESPPTAANLSLGWSAITGVPFAQVAS